MKKAIRWIHQHVCKHIDDPNNRNYKMPFWGYAFQCPKCNGYVAYFEKWDSYGNICKKDYIFFVEEGEKLRKRLLDYKEKAE